MIEQITKTDYDGLDSSRGHVIPGKAITDKLFELIEANNQQLSDSATILLGADNVVVAVGLAFDGKPASAQLSQVDATLTSILSAVWDGSGNLTITGNANATANTALSWAVDGR